MSALTPRESRELRRPALERASKIRAGITNYLETLAVIAVAYQERDWESLGYDGWDAYVDGEFGHERLRLSPEHRQKAVRELRLAGLSQRAIGHAVGVSQETVRRDLASGDSNVSPDEITGVDGKRYTAKPPLVEAMIEAIEDVGRVQTPDGPAVEPMPQPPGLVNTPIGPVTRAVADALAEHVPDRDPHAEWRIGFLKRVHAVHAVIRSKPADVAEMADAQCLDELAGCVKALTDYHRAVDRAVMASTPDNVTPIRRTS